MSDQDRPKSSWQSWVRAAETRRSSGSESPDALDLQSAEDDADLDVVLSWGDQPISQPGGRGEPDPDGELEEVNEAAETEAESTVGADFDLDDDFDLEDDFDDEADGVVVSIDDDASDDDGDGDYGELLPAVPLLPSIAGRVDALSGILRSISHRVDGLNAATDMYRSTIVDRIDGFTETVVDQGLRSEQALDEYRRTTERTIAELRRRIGEQGDTANRLLARVEELATDLGGLVRTDPSTGLAELRSQLDGLASAADLADLRSAIAEIAELAEAPEVETFVQERLEGIESTLSSTSAQLAELDAEQRALASTMSDLVSMQRAHEIRLQEVRELLGVVIDTMPGSAEGSAFDVGSAFAELQAAVARIPTTARAAPAGLAPAAIAEVAEAVVDRLDLDALAILIAEHLAENFEVETEAPQPAADPAG